MNLQQFEINCLVGDKIISQKIVGINKENIIKCWMAIHPKIKILSINETVISMEEFQYAVFTGEAVSHLQAQLN